MSTPNIPVPPILVAAPELPAVVDINNDNDGAVGLTVQQPAGGSSEGVGQPAHSVRGLLSEVKTYPEDIHALTVHPSLVAYLTAVYQQSALPGGSFASIRTPHVPSSRHRSAVYKALAAAANTLGLREAWHLVRTLSPSPSNDLSESFRLFFGSNISIFPYLASLAGTTGMIVCAFPIAYLLDACLQMLCDAKDVAVNVVLKQLMERERSRFLAGQFDGSPSVMSDAQKTSEQRIKELEDLSARHLSVSTYFSLAEVLWTYPKDTAPSTTDRELVPTSTSSQTGPTEQQQTACSSDCAATTSTGNDIVAVPPLPSPPPVEVRSYFPLIVRLVIGFAQFVSSCSFAVLLASNIYSLGLLDMSLKVALVFTCVVLTAVLCVLSSATLDVFAMINNIGLLGSSVILIVATVVAKPSSTSDTSSGDSTWMFFQSPRDAFMFFPTLLAYWTPALFAIDVETNIARRCIQRAVQRIKTGRDRSVDTPSTASPAASISIISSTTGSSGTTTTASHASGTTLDTHVLLRRFRYVSMGALLLSMVVLLSFGEFIFYHFKSKTNAVVALSLEPGTMQTILLWDLIISIFACAALNIVGLPNILDALHLSTLLGLGNKVPHSLERVVIRVGMMLAVLLTLFVIPYFDLVASLAGSLGVNGFTLFLPVLLNLQAIRRQHEAGVAHQCDASPRSPDHLVFVGGRAAHHRRVGWFEAFLLIPTLRRKVTMVIMLVLGTAMFTTGVGSTIVQFVERVQSNQSAEAAL